MLVCTYGFYHNYTIWGLCDLIRIQEAICSSFSIPSISEIKFMLEFVKQYPVLVQVLFAKDKD